MCDKLINTYKKQPIKNGDSVWCIYLHTDLVDMEYKSYEAAILINKEDPFSTFDRNSFKNFVQGKEENEF